MIDCQLDHVDGTMNALQRSSALEWLKDALGNVVHPHGTDKGMQNIFPLVRAVLGVFAHLL